MIALSPTPDLRYADPTWMAISPMALEWIMTAVDHMTQWDNHSASMLDYAYRVRVAILLRTHADVDDFRELNLHLLRVAHPIRAKKLNALGKPYAARWLAFSDILEDRLSVLGLAIPDMVKRRLHVRPILEWILPRQEVPQQELLKQFNRRRPTSPAS